MSAKTIWIWNHYATNTFFDRAGRHYWFAKKLKEQGYNASVFCANTTLGGRTCVDTGRNTYSIKSIDDINYVFLKTKEYKTNGTDRAIGMVSFFHSLFKSYKHIIKKCGKPDAILASSVHPLTLVAGVLIAKKLKIPCICEIRDLWPEDIFLNGIIKENSMLGQILLKGEHWIYKSSDHLIFTVQGDFDYIKEKQWDTESGGDVDLNRATYINNGIDIEEFRVRQQSHILEDVDLDDDGTFKVMYTGTIKPTNNVGNILDAAKIIMQSGKKYNDIKFLIYGDGTEIDGLAQRINRENITNVVIKGKIDRQYIPYILSKSAINILNYSSKGVNWSRGSSSNKLFEYLASERPVVSTVKVGYSLFDKYKCGVELNDNNPLQLANAIIYIHDLNDNKYKEMCVESYKAACDYDVSVMGEKICALINSVVN